MLLLEGKPVAIHGHCPNCDADWDAGEIPQEYIDKGYYEQGSHYSHLIGLEDPSIYDDYVSAWKCMTCGTTWCRWCGARLAPDERFHRPFHEEGKENE